MSIPITSPSRRRALHLAVCGTMLAHGGMLMAADNAPDPALLQRQINDLNARLQRVEQTSSPGAGGPGNPFGGLTFGAYGEVKFGLQQNTEDNGHWQNGFDGGRLTLLPSLQVNDRWLFKAEIEFEHGGMAFDDDDKAGGALEIEQAYLDWNINEHLHWRLPGIDVVPFGCTNLFHEPTLFYSVQRPELADGLIPTTWYGGATSLHGILAGPVNYQFQISSSLIDDGGNVRDATAGNQPAPLGYAPGISGSEALGPARPTTDGFKQENSTLAYALRLDYRIPAVTGLAGSTSAYYSPNIAPRGAYASDAHGARTGDLGHCALGMVDTELRLRPAGEGIEVRAEAVGIHFSAPANLRANNDGDPGDNVGGTMWGASGEVAWHMKTGSGWELVPFYRYTRVVLQTAGFAGLDDDQPSGNGIIDHQTVGWAVFPAPSIVLKLDYRHVRDRSGDDRKRDHVLGGVGFFF